MSPRSPYNIGGLAFPCLAFPLTGAAGLLDTRPGSVPTA